MRIMKRLSSLLWVFTAALLLFMACGPKSRRDEIEQRKAALKQKQDSTLQATQQQLAQVDSALEAAKIEHDQLHKWVMEHSTKLNNHSPEVEKLNQLRAHRDSLQVEWETLGAKIKYIRKKQEERQAAEQSQEPQPAE